MNCGHACIRKYLESKNIVVDFEKLNLHDKDALTFADFKAICNYYGVEGKGYYMEFDDVPNKTILHLKIQGFKHYIYLLKKGVFCIYYDNHGLHVIYRGILKLLYSKYVFIIE